MSSKLQIITHSTHFPWPQSCTFFDLKVVREMPRVLGWTTRPPQQFLVKTHSAKCSAYTYRVEDTQLSSQNSSTILFLKVIKWAQNLTGFLTVLDKLDSWMNIKESIFFVSMQWMKIASDSTSIVPVNSKSLKHNSQFPNNGQYAVT